jgi:hypothetical protein
MWRQLNGTGHPAMIEKCRPALPFMTLRVNGLFAALPQIE